MITMKFTPEVGKALHQLIEVASRKGRASKWWGDLVKPLTDSQSAEPSFHKLLSDAVKP